MAKPSRDELRQELNSQISIAKAKLAEIQSELQKLREERENLKSDTVEFQNKLKTDFSQQTSFSVESVEDKLADLNHQIKELEEEKENFITEKDSCLENIKQETKQAIQNHEKLLSDKFREKHDQEKDSWFKKLQTWSERQNDLFTEKLDNFVASETGKATNIVSQDILSKESRDLANDKSTQIMRAEIKLTVALVLMLTLGIIMYCYTPKMDLWNIVYKVLLFVPFGFYIWLQVRQMKRETCLRDHYHHKQLVMASYSAFFGFLKNNKKFTEEKQVQMTDQMFTEVRDNAANKADNHDMERLKMQNELLTKVIKKIPDLDKLNKNVSQIANLLKEHSEPNQDVQD